MSCGIVAFVFFKAGFSKWNAAIDKECNGLQGQQLKSAQYQVNKKMAMAVLADIYLEGNTGHQYIQKCMIFTRSLSYIPYIRDTYDSTTAPTVMKKLFDKNIDHLDPYDCDQPNLIILGSDFSEDEDGCGDMEGAVSIANRKINKKMLKK